MTKPKEALHYQESFQLKLNVKKEKNHVGKNNNNNNKLNYLTQYWHRKINC